MLWWYAYEFDQVKQQQPQLLHQAVLAYEFLFVCAPFFLKKLKGFTFQLLLPQLILRLHLFLNLVLYLLPPQVYFGRRNQKFHAW